MPLLYRSSINFLSFLETCDDFRRMYAFFSYPRILRFCLDLLLKLRRREDISSKSMKNKERKRHHIRSSWSCCFLSQDVKYRRCLTVGKEDDKRKPKNKMWLQIRFKLEKGLWKINNEWKIAVNKLRNLCKLLFTQTLLEEWSLDGNLFYLLNIIIIPVSDILDISAFYLHSVAYLHL